jgi:hypothetical protein
MLLKEYVNRIDEACGEGRDFIVILKYAKREEALRRILEKIEIERTLSRVMTKGRYEDRDISVFVTGKLIIKGLEGKKEAEEILGKLLE